jgi:sporulation protein YlmC with PRC-barrel domain
MILEDMTMKKFLVILTAMTFIAFGFASGASAAGMDKPAGSAAVMDQSMGKVSALIGKDVKDIKGEDLGKVKELIHDQDGKISLAIVSRGDITAEGAKDVAVPFSALSFNEGEEHFTLNTSKEQFANAPAFAGEENLKDFQFAEQVYRHFGEQPYWTEEGMPEGSVREYYGIDEGIMEPDAGVELDSDLDTLNRGEESVEGF